MQRSSLIVTVLRPAVRRLFSRGAGRTGIPAGASAGALAGIAAALWGVAHPAPVAAQTPCPTASLTAYAALAGIQCDVGGFRFGFPDPLYVFGGVAGVTMRPNPANVLVTPVSYGTLTDGAAGFRFTLNGELRSTSAEAMTGNNPCASHGLFCQGMNQAVAFGLTAEYVSPLYGVPFAIGFVNVSDEVVATTAAWEETTFTEWRINLFGSPVRYMQVRNGVAGVRCPVDPRSLPTALTPYDCPPSSFFITGGHFGFHVTTQVGLYDPTRPGGTTSPAGTTIADVTSFEVLAYSHTVLPPPYVAPEPTTIGLVATGLVGLGSVTWRRRSSSRGVPRGVRSPIRDGCRSDRR